MLCPVQGLMKGRSLYRGKISSASDFVRIIN